jgi:RNA polymerase sigma-70 factor (ECF subfamily)
MSGPPRADERITAWVREHAQVLGRFVARFVRDPQTIDDLVQETFVRAWRSQSRFVPRGSDRAYLIRIADRLIRDRARRPRLAVHLDDDGWAAREPEDDLPGPAADLLADEDERRLTEALDHLPPNQKRTLLLRYYGGLEFHEIARETESPLNTVLSHARRGLIALRKLLTER